MWQSIELEVVFKSPKDTNAFISVMRANGYSKSVTLSVSKKGPDTKEVVVSFKTGNEDIIHCVCEALWGRITNYQRYIKFFFDFRGQDTKVLEQYSARLNKHNIDADINGSYKYITLNVKRDLSYTNADVILGFIDYCKQIMITT